VIKQLLDQYMGDINSVFAKEALVLKQIDQQNIICVIAVCEEPKAIMMPYLEFSLEPFGADFKANCLGSFFNFIDANNFTTALPNIQRQTARDIVSAVSFLHLNNIVKKFECFCEKNRRKKKIEITLQGLQFFELFY